MVLLSVYLVLRTSCELFFEPWDLPRVLLLRRFVFSGDFFYFGGLSKVLFGNIMFFFS